jgi:hypothetical protein
MNVTTPMSHKREASLSHILGLFNTIETIYGISQALQPVNKSRPCEQAKIYFRTGDTITPAASMTTF